ncbi:MAG: hypothetical protein IJZ52_06885 [Clostridium sp.]|nr:hypothetical protein [Clostridium sp.]
MKQTSTESGHSFWSAVLCGALSLFADFILIPTVFRIPPMLGLPDPIWMSLMILIPVILALYLLERKTHVPPGYVWFGLPAQYLILIVFAEPISRIFSSDSWTYLWDAAVWPLGVTAAQFAVLIALRFRRTKSR